jgi:hypothetical protein
MVKQKVIEVRRFLRKSSGELAFPNNINGVFEYETDNKGNTIGKRGKGVKLWRKIKPNNQNLLNVHTIQQPDLIGLEQRSIEFENENINNTCSSQGNAYKLLPKFFWHRIQ